MGDIGLKRAKYLMELLGNPQNKLRIIHIAGTSGKGSTAYLMSHILRSQGFSVGLSISPHIFDIRERMQINNKLTDEKTILNYFHQILPFIEKMNNCQYGMPTFFEINIALAYYMFAQEKLDYVVMETGLGGMLDATNTVTSKNKICIITKIGLDHTEILGKTLAKISEQKAGIIQKQNIVISHQSSASALKIIRSRCEKQNNELHIIKPSHNFQIQKSTWQKTQFDFSFHQLALKNINLSLIGAYQAENCSLALATLSLISERDIFTINEIKLRKELENIHINGRCEIRKLGKQTLILDGAHNPQKMQSFVHNITQIYPKQKFTFIVAFKKGKDYKGMLKKIIPLADKILLSHFSTSSTDNHWNSINNQEISTFLRFLKFKNFSIISSEHPNILENVRLSKKPIIITGSLYLIGSMYKYID
jgi:dihydrofolate synthase/folylpolyglutamate synthase